MAAPPVRTWLGRFLTLSSTWLVACQGAAEVHSEHLAPGLQLAADEVVAAAPLSHGGEGAAGHSLRRDAIFLDTHGGGLPDARVPAATPDRMLVYRGSIMVEVARPAEAGAAFVASVRQLGGYLQSQHGTSFTVRVPAEHFDAVFAAVASMGRVLSERREASDVTEEFVDLGIRLDNCRQARSRLIEILGKADKVEDILKVEAELRRLTEEIERIEGRLKLLRDLVALATLAAEFQPVEAPPPGARPRRPSRFPWIGRLGPDVMGGF